jgi:two-component system, NtrC family, sensor kinase
MEDARPAPADAERVLRSVVEALDGALCIIGADGTVLDANRRWLHRLDTPSGTPPAHDDGPLPGAIGSDFFAWCRTTPALGDFGAEVARVVQDVVRAEVHRDGRDAATDEDSTGPERDRSVKGRLSGDGRPECWVVVRVHPIRDHDRARAVVSLIDITEGMRTQEQLRRTTEEAQRLALVARAIDKGVAITLPDGRIEWVNEPFVRRTGYSRDEAIGHLRADLVPAAYRGTPGFRAFLDAVQRAGAADGEFPMASRDGEHYWASFEVRPVVEDGAVTHVVWVEHDVTAQRDTQQRLREAMTRAESLAGALNREKTLLAAVISAVPQMVYWKDDKGRYVGCNAAYLTVRGLDHEARLLGHTEDDLCLDDEIGGHLRQLEAEVVDGGGTIVDRLVDLTDGQGRRRALLLSVLPLDRGDGQDRAVIGVGADITHANEMERQLAQANRLESIGQLAAGIAHEINTPVQYVTDNTRFLADATTQLLAAAQRLATTASDNGLAAVTEVLEPLELDFLGEEIPGALTGSIEGLSRVAEIVRAMKDYAHPGTGRADIDINRAISSTVQVCRNEWKYVAHVELDLDPDAGLVPAYEGDLKQVVLNMIVNAAQAIAEATPPDGRPGGTLGTIRIGTRRTDTEMIVSIADDGPGMDETVRGRVFDPFFTTKAVGRGTGQGLTLAHAVVVAKHHGRIELETAPGCGAAFTIHLPLITEEATAGT